MLVCICISKMSNSEFQSYVIFCSLPSGMQNTGISVTDVAPVTCPDQHLQRKARGNPGGEVGRVGMAHDSVGRVLPALLIQERWWARGWFSRPVGKRKLQPLSMVDFIRAGDYLNLHCFYLCLVSKLTLIAQYPLQISGMISLHEEIKREEFKHHLTD